MSSYSIFETQGYWPSASVYVKNILKFSVDIWNILDINPRRHLAKNL